MCWKKQGYFASDSGSFVEVYSCESEPISDHEGEYAKQQKLKRNIEAKKIIEQKLIAPLQKKYSLPINVYFKKDSKNIFHARHLRTQSAIILFDRGFDLFHYNGKLKRNIIKLDYPSLMHLKECEKLPDAFI